MKNQPVHQFIRINFKSVKVLFVCLVALSACKKTSDMAPIPKENSIKKATEWEYREGEIVLGKKLENPYSVENMQKAYDNLIKKYNSASKLNAENQTVKVSHLYIRWLPKSWEEYDELKNDRNLLLYDIPLDYAVEINGNKYHDKSIPEDLPTWQYTVIEKDYKYNKKIKHEILAEAYLPEKDKDLKQKNGRFAAGFSADELINEALTITKNTEYLIPLNTKNARLNNWTPAGKVLVHDTRIAANNAGKPINEHIYPFIGVQGVRVRARRFLSIESGVTNADGSYTAGGSFGGGANYALYWEAANFDIRSGTAGQAWVNGPYLASDWNVTFNTGVDKFHAHIFRGAWRYHYGDIGNLRRPNFNWNYKYAAFDSFRSAHCNRSNISIGGILNNVNIYRYNSNNPLNEIDSDGIFGAAIHETCHGIHSEIMNQGFVGQFGQVSDIIAESWPVAVEHFIIQKEYKARGIFNYADYNYFISGFGQFPRSNAYQYWKGNAGDPYYYYSSIFIDLIDTYNQVNFGFVPTGSLSYINDQISGYNMVQMENSIIPYTYGLSSLKDKLKQNKPSGVTDSMLDSFIDQYLPSTLP